MESVQFVPEPTRAKIFLSLMKVLISILTVLAAASTVQSARKEFTGKTPTFHSKVPMNKFADTIDHSTNGHRLLNPNTAFKTENGNDGKAERHSERPGERKTLMEEIEQMMNGSSLEEESPSIRKERIEKELTFLVVKHVIVYSSVSKYRFKIFVNIVKDYVDLHPDAELPEHLYLVDFFFPFRMNDRMIFDLLQKVKGCLGVRKNYGSGVKVLYDSLTEALKVAKYFKPGSSPDRNPLPDGIVIEYHRSHFYESRQSFFAH